MERLLFCNVGWMKHYLGADSTDLIEGGGSYVQQTGTGGEMHNFVPYNGNYYGYVQTVKGGSIRLERLGADANAAEISGITVVWTARHPSTGGTCVVGWYQHATVHRKYEELSTLPRRRTWSWQGREVGYYITTAITNTHLLPLDARTLAVPRGKGYMGQSNVWYADTDSAASFVQRVQAYIAAYTRTGRPPIARRPSPRRQPDVLKRLAVEQAAVACVWQHYAELGYELNSVEKDNIGWDLNAVADRLHLRLEVKGLSGSHLAVELTPNEYRAFVNPAHQTSYRLCVVTQALTAPQLHVFSFAPDKQQWLDERDRPLVTELITSARLTAG
jgi:hypothetical protein